MRLTIKGKHIYGNAKTKHEMLERLRDQIAYIKKLPDEAKIHNTGDDYIEFTVEPKDKDDRKYFKSLGFARFNAEESAGN
jgi:4-hydroxyphenylpyruvate dioxygenase-like putative hemolysin